MPNNNNNNNNNHNNNTVNDAIVSILHLTTDIHYTLSPTSMRSKYSVWLGMEMEFYNIRIRKYLLEGDNDIGIKDQ